MNNNKRFPMIEVFKTNVENYEQAIMLLNHIHQTFADYNANFDLQDCDKILRVKSSSNVEAHCLINFLKNFGCDAEVLPDEWQPTAISYVAEKY